MHLNKGLERFLVYESNSCVVRFLFVVDAVKVTSRRLPRLAGEGEGTKRSVSEGNFADCSGGDQSQPVEPKLLLSGLVWGLLASSVFWLLFNIVFVLD